MGTASAIFISVDFSSFFAVAEKIAFITKATKTVGITPNKISWMM